MILAEDECHLHLLARLRATWILRGGRQLVMTPGQNQRRSLLGAIDLSSGQWFYQLAARATSAALVRLLEQPAQAYAQAPVLAVVLDNVSIPSSRLVRDWRPSTPGCGSSTGLATAPTRTRWRGSGPSSKTQLADSPPPTMAARIGQVRRFFATATPARMLRTASPGNASWLPLHCGQDSWRAA